MAELADARGSGPRSRKGVEVRVLFSAPTFEVRIKGRGHPLLFIASGGCSFALSWHDRTWYYLVRSPLIDYRGMSHSLGIAETIFRQLLRLLMEKHIAQPPDRNHVSSDRSLSLRRRSAGQRSRSRARLNH